MDPSKSHDLKEPQSSNRSLSKTHDDFSSHYFPYPESPYPSSYNETSRATNESVFIPLKKPFDEGASTGPPYPQLLNLEPHEKEPQLRHGGVHSPSDPSKDQKASNRSENSKHRTNSKHHTQAKASKHKSRRTQQMSAHASSQADSTRAHASASSASQRGQGTGHAQASAGLDPNNIRSGQMQYWLDEPDTERPYHGYESFDDGEGY